MKKALVFVSLLALVASASASVQIFYTTAATGLDNPAMSFVPTEGLQTDMTTGDYHVGTFPTAAGNPTVGLGETVYVWFKFNGEPNSRVVQGLSLDTGATAAQLGNSAWYILDDMLGDNAEKRWDGVYTAPDYPEFRGPSHIFVATTAYGLRNVNLNAPARLYQGGTSRTYLLGAVSFSAAGTYQMAFAPGEDIAYAGGYADPVVEFGHITVTPEPASMLLLGLAGLLIRRR